MLPKTRRVRPWVFHGADDFVPHTRSSSDHVDSLVELCKAGGGIGQFMFLSVSDALRKGELVSLLEPWQANGPVVHALYQQQHQRAAKVRAFIDFVADLFPREVG